MQYLQGVRYASRVPANKPRFCASGELGQALQPARKVRTSERVKTGSLLTLLLFANAGALAQSPGWPQFGGPQRNFMVEAKGLAAAWPADGPKRL